MGETQEANGIVKLVVDANLIFSALLGAEGEVGRIISTSWPPLELFAPEALRVEIALHRSKIQRLSRYSTEELAMVENQLFERVTVIPNESIAPTIWEQAADLVRNVDERDDHYIALAIHLNCPLWTGDKKLVTGLRKKGFKLLLTSEELRKKLA